ncbi:MAG: hypothetical protein AAB656_00940 [Patescibacteria group bacterium]
MSKETKNISISEEEKEFLLTEAWENKKDKVDIDGSLALYVSVASPNPNLFLTSSITIQMLEALSASPQQAEEWSRTWGRVVVCIKPGFEQMCLLGEISDPKNKLFIPLKTKQKFAPTEIIGGFPNGDLAQIVINSQPTTIEAFLISYVHIVDELIWEHFRSSGSSDYPGALQSVISSGFSLVSACEDEILFQKKGNPLMSLRLYGSMVNKDVPRVMGGIIFKGAL